MNDYVLVNDIILDRVLSFSIIDRVESDHVPLWLSIDSGIQDRNNAKFRNKEDSTGKMRVIYSWTEEDTDKFIKRSRELCEEFKSEETDTSIKVWEDIK